MVSSSNIKEINSYCDDIKEHHKTILDYIKTIDVYGLKEDLTIIFGGFEKCLNRNLRLLNKNIVEYDIVLKDATDESYAYNYADLLNDILGFFIIDVEYHNRMINITMDSLDGEYLRIFEEYYKLCDDFKNKLNSLIING